MTDILFVDDERAVLEGLRLRLRRHRKTWNMRFVESGAAALAALAETHVDVVVTDLTMPHMDGVELLRRVREAHPDTVRIMLTGSTEPAAARRALGVAHQLVAKPCDAETLQRKISVCVDLRNDLSAPDLRAFVGRIQNLPPVPRLYARLSAVLDDRRAGSRDVSDVLAEDPAMCAKLLHVVNSAFFRLQRKITDVASAVSYLGVESVRALTLSEGFLHETPRMPPAFDHEALRVHSLRAADRKSVV